MVKLTQLEEDSENEILEQTAGNLVLDDGFTDTDSEVSDDEDDFFDIENETFVERIIALKDILPPQQRTNIVNFANGVTNFATSSVTNTGKFIWVITTSVLLVGTPLALSILSEQQLIEQEKEMNFDNKDVCELSYM